MQHNTHNATHEIYFKHTLLYFVALLGTYIFITYTLKIENVTYFTQMTHLSNKTFVLNCFYKLLVFVISSDSVRLV